MMVNSADFALKNVFINRDLSFLPRCAINVISLKVNNLKEYFNVNTLAQKYLFTFSGGKSGYKHIKAIKYINLVQCYFFSSTNNFQDRFLSRCFGIEKAVKNLISKRNNSTRTGFSNHFFYIMNVVFRRLCRREIFDLNLNGQYNDRRIIYKNYSHSRAIISSYCSASLNSIGYFYTYPGFNEVLKYRLFCIFGFKTVAVEIVEDPKKKVSNNQCITKLAKSYQRYFCYVNHEVTANHATFVLFRYLESYYFNSKSLNVTNRPYIPQGYLNEISRRLCHLLNNNINSMSYTYSGHALNATIGFINRTIVFYNCSVSSIQCYKKIACRAIYNSFVSSALNSTP